VAEITQANTNHFSKKVMILTHFQKEQLTVIVVKKKLIAVKNNFQHTVICFRQNLSRDPYI